MSATTDDLRGCVPCAVSSLDCQIGVFEVSLQTSFGEHAVLRRSPVDVVQSTTTKPP